MGAGVPARRAGRGDRARHPPGAAGRPRGRGAAAGRDPRRSRRGGRGGRGRAAGRRRLPRLRQRPDALLLPRHRHGQPDRPGAAGPPGPAGDARGAARRDPHRLHPRRGPAPLRARRPALRLHRRDRHSRPRPGPVLAGRQDPPDHSRRCPRARQPRPRLPRLDLGPPQRAGAGVRRRRQPVGQRVRRVDVRRAPRNPTPLPLYLHPTQLPSHTQPLGQRVRPDTYDDST